MVWRSIVLATLAMVFGIAAGVCIAVVAQLDAAIGAIEAHGDSGLTATQLASVNAMTSQGTALYLFAGPLVVGSLVSVVGFLVMLAWRWQVRPLSARH